MSKQHLIVNVTCTNWQITLSNSNNLMLVFCFTADALAFLRNQPTFQNMRRLVQENPGALPGLIQQIQTVNPDLFQVN